MCFFNGQIHSMLLLMGRKALEKLSPVHGSRECRMVESLNWQIMRAKSNGCHAWTHLIYINSHPPLELLYRTLKSLHRSPSTQAWLIPFKPSGLWPPCMVTEGVPASASIGMQRTLRPLPAPVSNTRGWWIVRVPPHETFLLNRIHWLWEKRFSPPKILLSFDSRFRRQRIVSQSCLLGLPQTSSWKKWEWLKWSYSKNKFTWFWKVILPQTWAGGGNAARWTDERSS